METEGKLIINKKYNRIQFKKIHNKIKKIKRILYCFFIIIMLINITTLIFVFINIIYKNGINLSNLSNDKLLKLKNDLQKEILNIEKIIKLRDETDKLSKNNNNELLRESSLKYEKNEKFNQNIRDKYIKEQKNFCDNQSIFYNKKIEDRIKIVDIEFKDKNYNMYVYRKADIVSQSIIENKNYEKSQTEKAIVALNYYSKKKNIKNEDIYIIDIGANIGWYTFIFGKYGYKVIAFEPSELNNYILKKNYCLNKETDVILINKGLYTEEKKCDLHLAAGNEGNGIVLCDKNKTLTYHFYKDKEGEILLTKLSNYIPFLTEKNLVLIKIDVEGGEGKAIESGIELITK